jgi:hypothetical protein
LARIEIIMTPLLSPPARAIRSGRRGPARDDGAAVADHLGRETMAVRRRGGRLGPGEASGQITRVERIAGGGGVDGIRHLDRRHENGVAGGRYQRSAGSQLDRHLADAQAVQAFDAGSRIGIAEQRPFVLEGRQGDVDTAERLRAGVPRPRTVGPAAWAIVRVEGDPSAGPAHGPGDLEQPGPGGLVQDRKRNAREIDQIVAGEPRAQLVAETPVQHVPRRRLPAPGVEGALAALIGTDCVEPGQPAG